MYLKEAPPLDALLRSWEEARQQEQTLRLNIKLAAEERLKAAKEQVVAAEKTIAESQRILDELFGKAPEIVPPTTNQGGIEASTWRWFNNELSGNACSPRLPSPKASQLSLSGSLTAQVGEVENQTGFNYLAMKALTDIDSLAEEDEHPSSTVMSVSLASSLGSLSESVSSESPERDLSGSLSAVKRKLASPLVAVRKESLATLLRAFDQILLSDPL